MLVHNPPPPQHTLRPRSAYTIYPANNKSTHMRLTFKKRLTQQLNRLLFPCHPESDRPTSATTSSPLALQPSSPSSAKVSSSLSSPSLFTRHQPTTAAAITTATIQEEQPDQTDFFENDERVIVHELNRLPSLKPPPRPKKTKAEATRSLESALSQSTLAIVQSSHFDDISELLRDDSSDTSLEEDDDEEDEEDESDIPGPQVALSVAILPSAVAAATAARSRRYQARVARAAQR